MKTNQNIFTMPSSWIGRRDVVENKKDDLRNEIQRLINRINELKLELRAFIERNGKKARESYLMLLEDMNDAAKELKDVLETLNALVLGS